MAALFARSSGIWVIQYKDGTGKIVTKSTGTRDRKAASFVKKDLEVQLTKGLIRDTKNINFEAYNPEYLRDIAHLRKKTRASYECITKKFIKFADKKQLSSIGYNDVIHFLDFYTKNAPKTYNNVLITLKRFFRYAVQRDYIQKNPTTGIHLRKIPQALPKFFTDEEYARIEAAAEKEPIYPMIVTARYTGMRLGELLALRWEHWSFPERVVRVLNTAEHTVKNYQARTIPVCTEALDKLLPYIRKEGPCFPTYCGQRQGQRYVEDGPKRQLDRIFKAAEITKKKRMGWHDFRHTFASRLAQEGVSIYKISKFLGHSSVLVTQIYAHFSPGYDLDIEKLTLGKCSPQMKEIDVSSFSPST